MADKVSENDASRREFVANVSHELRSPITSISGFVQGILDGTIPEEERMKYLGLVGDETRRLTRLISDLLALSRLERDDAALDRRAFDMCEMFRRAVIRRVNDLEKKNMEVDCEFSEDPCMVMGDPDRIEQVVVNLLDNAIKFTPDGGTVTLEIQPQGSKCCMVVRDNGIGISEEDRGRVFERFFTVDRAHTSGKGTGLGLSICQRIMQMHGESIRLLDTQSGAAFAFTLPRAGDNALPAAEEKGEA
jgi:signal transduction histidine kinase